MGRDQSSCQYMPVMGFSPLSHLPGSAVNFLKPSENWSVPSGMYCAQDTISGNALSHSPKIQQVKHWENCQWLQTQLPRLPASTATFECLWSSYKSPAYPPQDIPPSSEATSSKAFPLSIHASQLSSECNFKLEFTGILSHSNKAMSVHLNFSFPYICLR